MVDGYGYIRVSGKGQVEGHGLSRQREAIGAYAKANRIEVVTYFEDAGVSGTHELKNRPALGRLLVAVERNGIKTVLIEKLDRLARDLVVQELIIADLLRNGVTLVSVAEGAGLASDDPSRKLIRQIMGAVAEYDKTMLVLKLRAARNGIRATKGKCEGRKAFGEQDLRERVAVERIRGLRRKRPKQKRLGYLKIARMLEQEGHPTRGGGRWNASTVRNIIKGKVYQELGRRTRR